MFGLFPFIILLVAIIWVYQDGLRLRKKGVPINPGLVAGLIVLSYYLISWIGVIPSLSYKFKLFEYFGFGILFYFIQPFIPVLVYLFIKFTRYNKIVALGNPPLPPAPRWGFWFMLAAIFAPIVLFLPISFLFFRRGW